MRTGSALDVRNLFRMAMPSRRFTDEALAIRAPKRIVGGLLVNSRRRDFSGMSCEKDCGPIFSAWM